MECRGCKENKATEVPHPIDNMISGTVPGKYIRACNTKDSTRLGSGMVICCLKDYHHNISSVIPKGRRVSG